jgi:hypothetical protein
LLSVLIETWCWSGPAPLLTLEAMSASASSKAIFSSLRVPSLISAEQTEASPSLPFGSTAEPPSKSRDSETIGKLCRSTRKTEIPSCSLNRSMCGVLKSPDSLATGWWARKGSSGKTRIGAVGTAGAGAAAGAGCCGGGASAVEPAQAPSKRAMATRRRMVTSLLR